MRLLQLTNFVLNFFLIVAVNIQIKKTNKKNILSKKNKKKNSGWGLGGRPFPHQ